MGWFNTASMAGTQYLYWASTASEYNEATDSYDEQYTIKAVVYDAVNHCFTEPFDLLELSDAPRTVTLCVSHGDGKPVAYGLYSTSDNSKDDAETTWNFNGLEFTLKTALTLNRAMTENQYVTAGEKTKLIFEVENTGNTMVGSFDATISTTDGDTFGQFHFDVINPANNSFTVYHPDGSIAQTGESFALCRTPGQSASTMTLTTTTNGRQTVEQVAAVGIVPGYTAQYEATLTIPVTWKGEKEFIMTIDTVSTPVQGTQLFVSESTVQDQDAGIYSENERQAALLALNPTLTTVENQSVNKSLALDCDSEDLSLRLRVMKINGIEYVEVILANRADEGNREDADDTTLTFTAVDAFGNETVTFTHSFA